MQKTSLTLLIVVAAVAAGAAGYWLGQPRAIELRAITLYPQPKVIEPFELTGKDGQPFTKADWNDRWDMVFFGFTHCPDICPNALTMMRGIRQQLGDELSADQLPRVTLVSVDPERDTPARLREYVEYFDPSFLGTTGTSEQIAQVARQLNIAYAIEAHEPGDLSYNVDHFAGILLINPQAQVHGIFTMPHDPAAIAADLRALISG